MTSIVRIRFTVDNIDVYRGDTDEWVVSFPLAELLDEALLPDLGGSIGQPIYRIRQEAQYDPGDFDGPPLLRNRRPDVGTVLLTATVDGVEHYRHWHPVRTLLGPPLARRLRDLEPDQPVWSYEMDPAALRIEHLGEVGHVERPADRPAPHVEGVIEIDQQQDRKGPRLAVRKVADPQIQQVSLQGQGIAEADLRTVNVLLSGEIYDSLVRDLPMSRETEEGGFLAGDIRRLAEAPDKYVLRVKMIMPAEHSGASLYHFTFTGDSFQSMNAELAREAPNERLLGWYHSHLFVAADLMGLSSVDVDLHFRTFRQPWQVAGLINIAKNGGRTVRFFSRVGDEMKDCGLWIGDERDGYNPVSPALDRW
jgi:proteasome lid subunit RPN8/RPN11